jgi:hypothetical protein
VLLAAVLSFQWSTRPVVLPMPVSIEVTLVPATPIADSPAASDTLAVVVPAPSPEDSVPPPVSEDQPVRNSVPVVRTDGLTHASKLYAGSILKEPSSREVRQTLPTLEPYERMTQLCNIEAVEQIARQNPKIHPDSVAATAFDESHLANGRLDALGAAFRADKKWYHLRFECRTDANFTTVTEFAFAIEGAIAEDQWDAHGLLAEDEDDD